mmetsp:Transcript_120754/g.367203  ORF Transcript_120754/g.367203 Transcript_120754/m.367203 type:complete len:89 (+) Transcript_120754:398-664(+)
MHKRRRQVLQRKAGQIQQIPGLHLARHLPHDYMGKSETPGHYLCQSQVWQYLHAPLLLNHIHGVCRPSDRRHHSKMMPLMNRPGLPLL